MVVVFVLCWGPYAVLALMGIFGQAEVKTSSKFLFSRNPVSECAALYYRLSTTACKNFHHVESDYLHLYEQKRKLDSYLHLPFYFIILCSSSTVSAPAWGAPGGAAQSPPRCSAQWGRGRRRTIATKSFLSCYSLVFFYWMYTPRCWQIETTHLSWNYCTAKPQPISWFGSFFRPRGKISAEIRTNGKTEKGKEKRQDSLKLTRKKRADKINFKEKM